MPSRPTGETTIPPSPEPPMPRICLNSEWSSCIKPTRVHGIFFACVGIGSPSIWGPRVWSRSLALNDRIPLSTVARPALPATS